MSEGGYQFDRWGRIINPPQAPAASAPSNVEGWAGKMGGFVPLGNSTAVRPAALNATLIDAKAPYAGKAEEMVVTLRQTGSINFLLQWGSHDGASHEIDSRTLGLVFQQGTVQFPIKASRVSLQVFSNNNASDVNANLARGRCEKPVMVQIEAAIAAGNTLTVPAASVWPFADAFKFIESVNDAAFPIPFTAASGGFGFDVAAGEEMEWLDIASTADALTVLNASPDNMTGRLLVRLGLS